MLEQRAHRSKLGVRQVLDFCRQTRRELLQRSADAEDRRDFQKRLEDALAAELRDELLPALAIAGNGRKRLLNGRQRLGLEIMDQPIGPSDISSGEGRRRLAKKCLCFRGQEVALEPRPDPRQG
jgi:hypothetical protein